MGAGSFPAVKRLGRGVDHPPPSSAEVKERVELYIYSPWAFGACSRVNCTFTIERREVMFHPFLTSALHRGEWSTSHSGHFNPGTYPGAVEQQVGLP